MTTTAAQDLAEFERYLHSLNGEAYKLALEQMILRLNAEKAAAESKRKPPKYVPSQIEQEAGTVDKPGFAEFVASVPPETWVRYDVHAAAMGWLAAKRDGAAEQPRQPMGAELTFDAFRAANVARCVKWHPAGISSWSPSDWLTAVTGELGELASLLKMRNRERDGLPGNKFSPTQKQVADEIADVLTYLDLLAEALGVNLGRAAVSKFNEVSERVGFPDRISLDWTWMPQAAKAAPQVKQEAVAESPYLGHVTDDQLREEITARGFMMCRWEPIGFVPKARDTRHLRYIGNRWLSGLQPPKEGG